MLPASLIWSLAGGSALVLLGIWVLRLSARRPANVAVAVFAVSIGMRPVLFDLGEHFGATTIAWWAAAPFLAASVAVLLWLTLRFPDPASRGVRLAAFAGGSVALASFVIGYEHVERIVGGIVGASDPPWILRAGGWIATHGYNLHLLAFLVPLVALPVRAAVARDPQTAGRAAALASALTLYPASLAIIAFLGLVDRTFFFPVLTMLAAAPVVAALWLYAAHRGPAASSSRNVALLTLGAPLFFVLQGLYGLRLPSTDVARIATVLFLVVAIVRGQLLSADTAMRWTISRGSIAAVFIAIFFVASEAAQQFFGDTLGGTYAGILAAGALVFVIAPLSRLADRVAEKAVPVVEAPAPTVPHRRLDVYRNAVRYALRDGSLSRKEELHLAHLAEELGIGAGAAMELRHEVEGEHTGGAR